MYIFIVFLIFLIVNQTVLNYLDNKAENYYETRKSLGKTNPKVYDIGHRFLPDWHENKYYHHIITASLLLPLFSNSSLLTEFLSYSIVILTIRMIINLVTILPKHKRCCVGNSFIVGGCYDKIFSGHFSTVFLATILYQKYGMINWNTVIAMNLLNAFGILTSRSHYTVDLLVAFFVTLFVYQNNIRVIT